MQIPTGHWSMWCLSENPFSRHMAHTSRIWRVVKCTVSFLTVFHAFQVAGLKMRWTSVLLALMVFCSVSSLWFGACTARRRSDWCVASWVACVASIRARSCRFFLSAGDVFQPSYTAIIALRQQNLSRDNRNQQKPILKIRCEATASYYICFNACASTISTSACHMDFPCYQPPGGITPWVSKEDLFRFVPCQTLKV